MAEPEPPERTVLAKLQLTRRAVRLPPRSEGSAEHRLARRFDVSLEVEFQSDREFVIEHATNISRGGLFVRTSRRPAVDSVVRVNVKLPSGAQIEGAAVVAHVREGEPGGVGLVFLSEDRSFANGLDAYLASLASAEARLPRPPTFDTSGFELEPLPEDRAAAKAAPEPKRRSGEPFGSYVLLERIGRGAMSEVFRARAADEQDGRDLALKRIVKERARDALARELMNQEASLAPVLRNEHIVSVIDRGEWDGQPFLVMERVDGADAGTLMEFLRGRGMELPVEVALLVVRSVLAALVHAHGAEKGGRALRVLHCDVSAGNVLVAVDGAVKLADFGAAQVRGGVSLSAARVGKQRYRSPELLRGEISANADLWSTAVLLYELLALRSPFDGESAEEVHRAILQGRIEPLRAWAPHVPDAVELILSRALAPAPAQRFRTAAEFHSAVSSALGDPQPARETLASIVRTFDIERRHTAAGAED